MKMEADSRTRWAVGGLEHNFPQAQTLSCTVLFDNGCFYVFKLLADKFGRLLRVLSADPQQTVPGVVEAALIREPAA